METKTYRVKTMQEALSLIRRDFGPDASVLHTREVRGGLFSRFIGARQIEVTASATVSVPSKFARNDRRAGDEALPARAPTQTATAPVTVKPSPVPPAHEQDFRAKFRSNLHGQLGDLHSMMEDLCRQKDRLHRPELPETLFQLFTDLIDAEVNEDLARELVDRVRSGSSGHDLDDPMLMKARIARLIEDEIKVCGPICITPGTRRLVALVGPTGVGKTTTIAKLAANFRLRQRCRVGLITVDTYRIAAVDQLRTYADIIDLPMEVVSTPREMREAVKRLSNLDLVLLDTAGRSPKDEVKIQELKSMLSEAQADEVHLVLSAVTGTETLKKTAQRFATVGVTGLILTKLDEATGLGNLLPLLRSSGLPLSYTTNGQNVPDDIDDANQRRLGRIVLGMES